MVRTQIYITDKERESLQDIVRRTGRSQSNLIREAIESFLDQFSMPERRTLIKQAKGVWKDRKDLPEFRLIRNEFDRVPNSPADEK